MAICITFGTHEFTSMLEGYENVRAYCYNCEWIGCSALPAWSSGPDLTKAFCMNQVNIGTDIALQDGRGSLFALFDRPDITPDTRPPPGAITGPAPPPQAYYPPQGTQPPQGYGYK
ncbi:rhodopsin family protein [Aspergillus affinis]|uniref:rhodopsin family protein n=1 Tax=Aspergillus affinis TaxID=1070780 RepID=UPI0022FE74A9|nr:uncharacterized protein KD926_004573 [Aspergillus affinis]KAI9043070.1 hypothetical protein KD926_004573 [Aspergillus affinis]